MVGCLGLDEGQPYKEMKRIDVFPRVLSIVHSVSIWVALYPSMKELEIRIIMPCRE